MIELLGIHTINIVESAASISGSTQKRRLQCKLEMRQRAL